MVVPKQSGHKIVVGTLIKAAMAMLIGQDPIWGAATSCSGMGTQLG